MPRKDRRFKGEDLRRLYCKNLTPTQRRLFDITVCDWDDYSPLEKVVEIMDALVETGLLDQIAAYVPRGQYVKQAVEMARLILGGADLAQIDYVPISFLDQISGLFKDSVDAIEALGGSDAFQGLILDALEFVE